MFAYFILLPLLAAVLKNVFGSVYDIINNVIDLIPFGESLYGLAIQIVNSITGQVMNYSTVTGYFTFTYFLEELLKGLFTVIIFEASNLFMCIVLGFTDSRGKIKPEGMWNKAKYVLISLIDALISACLAPFLMNYIFSSLPSLGSVWSVVISSLMSVILIGGGIAFFLFLAELSIGMAIAYVLIKFILIGVIRLTLSYLSIFLILIGWDNRTYLLSVGGFAGLIGVGLLLAGIEIIVKSAFEK